MKPHFKYTIFVRKQKKNKVGLIKKEKVRKENEEKIWYVQRDIFFPPSFRTLIHKQV